MTTVRYGIIGLGNMGGTHAAYLDAIAGAKLTAVCDIDAEKTKAVIEKQGVPGFQSADQLIESGLCDAVIIATPHYDHAPIGIAALRAGLHVLTEKPIAVSVTAARELAAEAEKHPGQKFGIVFNQRTNPMYQKLRDVIADGELGAVTRVTWLITDWFRTHAYYGSGGWRATWAGEGGGVLINQCPHNLDLIQWITGLMPSRITAVGFVGKTHPIEVEDEVSAILEYPTGAIGHFVTSTGEAPGTNRLEICGDRGKIVAERGKLSFWRTRRSVREINETSPESFASPEVWETEIPYGRSSEPSEHKRLIADFTRSILHDTPLLAPGVEGVRGLEIGNAMLMSAMTRKPVELPVDGAAYDTLLLKLATKHGGRKALATRAAEVDMGASFR